MIQLAKPFLGENEAAAAAETILSGWVTQGPRVAKFESSFADFVSSSHACAVSNCTTALHLSLLAAGVKAGDVVLTVSHSFIATANAVRQCNAEPVFVDIDYRSGNMSPQALEQTLEEDFKLVNDDLLYTQLDRFADLSECHLNHIAHPRGRLGAILIVHQAGMPADMEQLLKIASKYSIPIIEDAACAIGSELFINNEWCKVGLPMGVVTCFSFHPRKVITTGDGGMITTNSPEINAQLRLLRQHGMSVSDSVRHSSNKVIFEDYVTTGFNSRMTDIQAAVGYEQLLQLPQIVEGRRIIAKQYAGLLQDIAGVSAPYQPEYARSNWQSYIVQLDDSSQQKKIMQFMLEKGIQTRRGIMCAHQESPYRSAWQNASLRNSEKAFEHGIALPLHLSMSSDEVEYICETLATALKL